MGRRGPPPKPIELKVRLGNPGKRPLPKPLTVIAPSVAAASRPTFTCGAEVLQHILDNGGSAWIGATDVRADSFVSLYDDWLLAQERWRSHPDVAAFNAYDKLTGRLHVWLSNLGLDPPSRGNLGLAQVKARSALEELRDRKTRSLAGRPGS